MAILYKKEGKIATITINRPEARNALDPDTLKEFSDALVDFKDNPDLWVAIVTGAGDRAFSAGADIRETLPLMAGKVTGEFWQPPPNIMRGLEIWKPLIAAINGMALGGGLEVALACDLRIAAENATFGQPEVGLGLIPGWGGTQRLHRMIPRAKAAELILMAQRIDAQEAYRLGLVNKVVPLSELLPTAKQWAEAICKLGPLGVRAAKEAMIKGLSLPLEAGLRLETLLLNSTFQTEDFDEGVKAFSERRPPEFKAK